MLAGIVITLLVQSSSATIALVIATVGAGVLSVQASVFILMGANIGTTITNTIVGVAYGRKNEDFRKILPAILIDDLFKVLNVSLFFLLEMATGFLYSSSKYLICFSLF